MEKYTLQQEISALIEKNRYINSEQASRYLSITRGSLYNLVNQGQIKAYKFGARKYGSLRFTICDLDRFMGIEDGNKEDLKR
jgi:excisionase family DNA binding protein